MKIANTETMREFITTGIVHPTITHGRGRFAKNYTAAGWKPNRDGSIPALLAAGLVLHRHYTTGNDAPRGGKFGNYVKLTAAGRRLKVVREFLEGVI